MSGRNFRELIEARWAEGKFVCVGLDSEFAKIPKEVPSKSSLRPGLVGFLGRLPPASQKVLMFNVAIIDATCDLVCAYKPNIAFYEALGDVGWDALRETIVHIRTVAPDVPVILDAKRADIGNTNNGYVEMAFDWLQADAITVHPYLGAEALQPFLGRAGKGIFVLCRTSNPGADEFQDLSVNGGEPLYLFVARRVANEWNKNGNCALVVGATYPYELREVRNIVGDMPILIPGVGFQQKDVPKEKQIEQVVTASKDSRGRGMIINSSRGVIFASSGPDFVTAARREVLDLQEAINKCLRKESVYGRA